MLFQNQYALKNCCIISFKVLCKRMINEYTSSDLGYKEQLN